MKLRRLIIVVLLAALAGAQTAAPQKHGALSGTVVDSSGAVIAGAKVTLKVAGSTKSIFTDADGRFLFADIAVGTYSVQIDKNLFKPADIKGLTVEESKPSDIRVGLVAGKKGEVVEIIDPASGVDTTSTSTNNCLTEFEMESLPMDRNIGSALTVARRCP